jgi:antitoxin VapB
MPKAVALPESVKQVDIIPIGRGRLIVPAGESWDSWFAGEGVSDDFMSERDQPADQAREGL